MSQYGNMRLDILSNRDCVPKLLAMPAVYNAIMEQVDTCTTILFLLFRGIS